MTIFSEIKFNISDLEFHFEVSLIISDLNACLRDLICPLHIPLVRLHLPELCFQFGVFIVEERDCGF